jgi:transmembrane sensor
VKDDRKPAAGNAERADLDSLLSSSRDLLKARFPLPARRQRPASPPRRMRRAALAAGLLAAFAVWLADPVYRQEDYASSATARQPVMLADGTRLDLDVASRVTMRWSLRTRQAELTAGRVLFSVAPARLRPFEVTADTLRIRVVGTQFDVRRQDHDVTVNVAEGRVAVQGADAALELTAGQRFASRAGQLGPIGAVTPEAVLAWRDGRVLFERTPLAQALAELQAYVGQPVRAVGPAQALEVSGLFDSARADDFVATLPEILPVFISRAADGALEIRKK